MSYEKDKSDFESALDNQRDLIDQLDGVLHADMIAVLKDVVDEYEGGLSGAIDDMANTIAVYEEAE